MVLVYQPYPYMEQLEFDFYKKIIDKLDNGQEATIVFNGPFMEPLIKPGQTCTISPIDCNNGFDNIGVNIGDIVFRDLSRNNSSLFLVKGKENYCLLLGNAKNSDSDRKLSYLNLICGKVTKIN